MWLVAVSVSNIFSWLAWGLGVMKEFLFIVAVAIVGKISAYLSLVVSGQHSIIFAVGAAVLPLGLYLSFRNKFS